ncbi:hypothetical protein VQ056_02210 [Paenibacillus sp. JTLBN-2024]|jgi:hypothetical protein|uniref:hypothetical protein n=1 Tax=Paenibacillus sp. FSL M7-1455 TaxID=2975316 RepID=UPI0030FB5C67
MWILVSKFRWSHSHLFTVVDPLLDDRHRILMRFRNSGLFSFVVTVTLLFFEPQIKLRFSLLKDFKETRVLPLITTGGESGVIISLFTISLTFDAAYVGTEANINTKHTAKKALIIFLIAILHNLHQVELVVSY